MSLRQTLPLLLVIVLILAGSNVFYSSVQQDLTQIRLEQHQILEQVRTRMLDSHRNERLGGSSNNKDATAALKKTILRLEMEQKDLLKQIESIKETQEKHMSQEEVVSSSKASAAIISRQAAEEASNALPKEEPHTAPGTVVTAYFQIPSKHSAGSYMEWMGNMLSIDDPVIIFTTPDWVDRMKELRQHATNRTVVIPVTLDQLPMATNYNKTTWEHQFKDLDPISRYRKSYNLYWIWLSKSHFVNEAIRLNPFESTHFMWSDIGCYRFKNLRDTFANRTMMAHLERIPDKSVLLMAHRDPVPPTDLWFSSADGGSTNFFTSGSSFCCKKEICVEFHQLFLQTLQGYMDRNLFVGEDQIILQSTCMQHPDICRYVIWGQVKPNDSSYFALRTVLRFGGDHYKYWKPPELLTNEQSVVV